MEAEISNLTEEKETLLKMALEKENKVDIS